jgi:outer membrane protein assembly factor BamE (lipoprotein component of BamABCDE complex)
MKKIAASVSKLVALAVLAFALSACGSKLNNDNLAKVKNGMSTVEVKGILGQPTRVETGSILGLEGTTFYYEKHGSKVQISFINDQVTVKLGSFGEAK